MKSLSEMTAGFKEKKYFYAVHIDNNENSVLVFFYFSSSYSLKIVKVFSTFL